MRKLIVLLLTCCSLSVWSQVNPCCSNCTCLTCGEVDYCAGLPGDLGDPATCVSGGRDTCGTDTDSPTGPILCLDFAENNTTNGGVCVPIDGGLGFLIAGGLGMGVLGIRRRKEESVVEAA